MSVLISVLGVIAFGCGSKNAAETQHVERKASECKSAEECLKECTAGTTRNACRRAGQKKCALYDGKWCNDLATVHSIFAKLLEASAPSIAARHKTSAQDQFRKACGFGVKTACDQDTTPSDVFKVVPRKQGTSLPKPKLAPRAPRPFAKPPPAQPNVTAGKTISPDLLERLRTRGTRTVYAEPSVRMRMKRNGDQTLITAVKVCIDRHGSVSNQTTLSTSRYRRYEDKVRRQINLWRFRPYLVNGLAQPACAIYTFIVRAR